jgi:hypothetical protein
MKTLKLSDAIRRGSSMKLPDPRVFLSPDGRCGCAAGGALLAAGVTPAEWQRDFDNSTFIEDLPCIRSRWPWLTAAYISRISVMYFAVCDDIMDIDDLVKWVREVEPSETSEDAPLDIPGVHKPTVEEFAEALCEA